MALSKNNANQARSSQFLISAERSPSFCLQRIQRRKRKGHQSAGPCFAYTQGECVCPKGRVGDVHQRWTAGRLVSWHLNYESGHYSLNKLGRRPKTRLSFQWNIHAANAAAPELISHAISPTNKTTAARRWRRPLTQWPPPYHGYRESERPRAPPLLDTRCMLSAAAAGCIKMNSSRKLASSPSAQT